MFSCLRPAKPRASYLRDIVDATPVTDVRSPILYPRASSIYTNLDWLDIEELGRPQSEILEGRPRPESYTLPPGVLGTIIEAVPMPVTPLSEQRSTLRRLSSFLPPPRLPITLENRLTLIEVALAYVLQNEGSSFVNDPDDHGGATRYGVTQATLTAFLGRAASIADVQALTPQTVTEVYRKLYWQPIRGDEIKAQAVATVLLDMAVLCGPTAAVRMAQGIVKALPDGLLGPKTLASINGYPPANFVQAFSLAACQYFQDIALRDKTQAKWLAGWCYRAHKMNLQLSA